MAYEYTDSYKRYRISQKCRDTCKRRYHRQKIALGRPPSTQRNKMRRLNRYRKLYPNTINARRFIYACRGAATLIKAAAMAIACDKRKRQTARYKEQTKIRRETAKYKEQKNINRSKKKCGDWWLVNMIAAHINTELAKYAEGTSIKDLKAHVGPASC